MPLFLLLAAATGLFLLSSKKTQPASAQAPSPAALPPAPTALVVSNVSPGIVPTVSKKPIGLVPANVTKAVGDAIASLDPQIIGNLAAQLDQQGFNQQAADLREFSKGMMSAMNKA